MADDAAAGVMEDARGLGRTLVRGELAIALVAVEHEFPLGEAVAGIQLGPPAGRCARWHTCDSKASRAGMVAAATCALRCCGLAPTEALARGGYRDRHG